MITLYPVQFGGDEGHIVFVGLDRQAAEAFALAENDEVQCEVMEVMELALVDTFGFPCQRREAAFVAPWLAKVSDACHRWYAPESWDRYVREMSRCG